MAVGRAFKARLTGDGEHVNPLVREVRVIDNAAVDDVGPTPILVNARADVVIGRRDVGDVAIGAPSDEHIAAAFLRTPLEPVDVVAVAGDETQAESLFSNCLGRDGRSPGAVRSDERHALNVSSTQPCVRPFASSFSLAPSHRNGALPRGRWQSPAFDWSHACRTGRS